MELPHWGTDDARIIGDAFLAFLLIGGARLVFVKAIAEPLAVWLGQRGYRWLDDRAEDRLPDLFRGDRDE